MTSTADRAAEKVRVLLNLDRNEDAAQAARAELQGDPNNAELLGLLAFALQAGGHPRDARVWAERSLTIDPHQAEVFDTRARAILDGAGTPDEAVESARAAVKLDHTTAVYRFDLVRAYLEAEQWEAAQSTAKSIRTVAPTSPLGPFAQAIVELDRARYLAFSKRDLFWLALTSVFSGGIVLLFWATVWVVIYFQGRGPRRRAAAHLVEGLQLDPGAVHLHSVAAHVASRRFRYIQSVDSALAAAAIDGGMVDANELARGIVRRTTWATAAAFVGWMVVVLFVHDPIIGTVLMVAAAAAVVWLDREQTKRLPPGALRLVRRRWGLPLAMLPMVAWMGALGLGSWSEPGTAIPAFVGAAILLISIGVLTGKLVSARRIG